MMSKMLGLRIKDEQMSELQNLSEVLENTNQETIRTMIDIFPKLMKLMYDNKVQAPAYFFNKDEERLIKTKITQMKEDGLLE